MTPDKVQARKLVLVGVVVLALTAVYRSRQDGNDTTTFRALWGVGVVGWFLSLLADVVPTIAGPFAVLVALGSLTNGGDKLLSQALGVIVPAPAKTSPAPAPARPASGSTPAPTPLRP